MSGALIRRLTGADIVSYGTDDRRMTRMRRAIQDEVQIVGMQVDGALALGSHIMEGLDKLDDDRRRLANGDVSKNLIFSEIQETSMRQCKALQKSLYNARDL